MNEGLLVHGGVGSDTFILDLSINDDAEWIETNGAGNAGSGIEIADFDPEEDQLLVEVSAIASEEDNTYTVELVEVSETEYTLRFDIFESDLPEGMLQRGFSLTILTTGPITLDEIAFVGQPPATAAA